LKFTIFVVVATRVDMAEVSIKTFDWPTMKMPYWVQISGPVLNASQVVVHFVLKFSNFHYHESHWLV